ncbi:MAG: tetratricopeptide repeat protein [Gemmatimonadales bacterium]
MSDDIRALTAQVAADPGSLVFLELAEALRRQGQLDAAQKVVLSGLQRYPHLPAAHDLYARVLADRQDYEHAFDEWDMALKLDPRNLGALKGLGFLFYRAADHANALGHLEAAFRQAPGDEGLRTAIERLREIIGESPAPVVHIPSAASSIPLPAVPPVASPPPEEMVVPAGLVDPTRPSPFGPLQGAVGQRLLVERGGLRLAGEVVTWTGEDVSERAAIEAEAVAHEVRRMAEQLAMGAWRTLVIESDAMLACLVAPTDRTVLVEIQEVNQPIGQITLTAERAARAARQWLGEEG